jgi:hypothetical protein
MLPPRFESGLKKFMKYGIAAGAVVPARERKPCPGSRTSSNPGPGPGRKYRSARATRIMHRLFIRQRLGPSLSGLLVIVLLVIVLPGGLAATCSDCFSSSLPHRRVTHACPCMPGPKWPGPRGMRGSHIRSGKPAVVAPNPLQRQFAVSAPNKAWVTDITYIRTHEGWLHLAAVLDPFSRQVVG